MTLPKKKARTVACISKDMGTVFWNEDECTLVDFLSKSENNQYSHTEAL
jgi:uncharacterized protein YfcZ (UPF0381/DUF406 family)